MFISAEQRDKLSVAKKILDDVKEKIDDHYREYRLVDTAIDSIEDAIEKEKMSNQ